MRTKRKETISDLLENIAHDAMEYFKKCPSKKSQEEYYDAEKYSIYDEFDYWSELESALQEEADKLATRLANLAQRTGPAIRRAPLLTEADERGAGEDFKTMRAALRFQSFEHSDAEVLHDEGTALGIQPARDWERRTNPETAARCFEASLISLKRRLELADPRPTEPTELTFKNHEPIAAGFRPGTAFVMMWMSKDRPELTDVYDTIKRCFDDFGITAIRADEIEHEDVITNRILDQIKTAEFLIADLTGERPSVYYEVGFAHAIRRRVILFRNTGTPIHFDLAAYNCPEYANLADLRRMLMKRLESLTGGPPKTGG